MAAQFVHRRITILLARVRRSALAVVAFAASAAPLAAQIFATDDAAIKGKWRLDMAAMLAYLASEDPTLLSRERVDPSRQTADRAAAPGAAARDGCCCGGAWGAWGACGV